MNNAERLGEILKSLEKQEVTIDVQFELLRVLAADCAHRLDHIAARASGLPDLSPKTENMDELTFELAFAEMAVALEALAKRQEEFPNEPEPEPKT